MRRKKTMSNSATEWVGCGVAAVATAVQTNEVLQVISIVLTCLATTVTIAFNLWKWYKAAKEDGKIDEKEIQEGIDIVKDGVEELVEKTKGDKNA